MTILHASADWNVQVPEEVFREVASPDQLARLQQYIMRSFVEDNRAMTWCPAPGAPSLSSLACLAQAGLQHLWQHAQVPGRFESMNWPYVPVCTGMAS